VILWLNNEEQLWLLAIISNFVMAAIGVDINKTVTAIELRNEL